MKRKLQLLNKHVGLLLLLLAPQLYAQWQDGLWIGKQGNNWCDTFNKGISWNTGAPVIFTGVQLSALEGSATASDENGNLLFYAGQHTIWNKNHLVMLNGTGLIGGNNSSTQAGVWVQKPGSTNIYYLFNVNTADAISGLLYSEIDLSLDGGLGGVTANKNIVADASVGVEKITAVHHADGEGVWVISHRTGSNEFVAYLVTSNGVSATPVVSAIGTLYTAPTPADQLSPSEHGGMGQMKVSPDGAHIAASILNGPDKGVELFDFDTTTGVVSNLTELSVSNPGSPYGMEFSPNGQFLYVSDPVGGYVFGGAIRQFDVTLATSADITASVATVVTFPFNGAGGPCGMQLAADGKIYVKDVVGGAINAISYPNNQGLAAGFTQSAVAMSSSIGTPTFIQSYFESGIIAGEGCPGVVAFSLLRIPDATSIAWNFGDPASGAANTSTIGEHAFSAGGTYIVTAVITSNGGTQTATGQFVVSPPNGNITTPANLVQCADSNGTALFNLATQTPIILGSLDATIYTITYYPTEADALAGTNAIATPTTFTSGGQTIYAAVTNSGNACISYTQFNLVVTPALVLPQLPNLQTCDTNAVDGFAIFDLTSQNATLLQGLTGATAAYYTTEADALAGTNPITTATMFTNTSNPQTIYAGVTVTGGCSAATSFVIEVTPPVQLPQPANLQACDTAAADGFTNFNLTSQNAALLQGLTGATVAYYTNLADAQAGTNAIATPGSFTNTANPQTIYAMVTSATGCLSTASFTIEVWPALQLPQVANLQDCDAGAPDGFSNFDLTAQNATLLTGLPSGTVAYYISQTDAVAGTNAVATPANFVNTANPQTIYAVVTNGTTGCSAITNFTLNVIPVPIAPQVSDLQSCDTDAQDGSASFDLTVHTDALLQGQPGYTVAYFTTLADAQANSNAIANASAFTNTTNPQTIYARIASGNCFAVSTFNLSVLSTPQIGGALLIVGCPPFNLPAVVSGNGLDFTYYTTEADATAQTNAIASPGAYVNTNGSAIVYVRAESAEGCEAFAEITLDTGDCAIPKGISPNNDGMNDAFDLSYFDIQKLSVFNRYGQKVYALPNYTNQWCGQQDNGNELPTGTYYYVIEFAAGNSKTGWVYVNRQEN
ncbi:T9SS type B sorting domain-containing protein [Flavobacterium subsaxonicum]|uniref:PKD domain-containing protein n=1 Tax=Flavobacterium subsaxonicum WB 4.1-42 = DSM 21790 TaxID=1121898 RepID=A0A0A2MRN3_9FLAO|nr:gliding motility-associated C-terminal domain-containing protein [Flavobacterium subsaxonicum]KGO90920.1 hypothetical protein Q766_20710 [Flavobacterium subsaxonicum WB 4.1-42 = DSM 21790]